MSRLSRWFRRSRPCVGGPVGLIPSPADVASRVRPQADLAPEKPVSPPVRVDDPGRTPEVDPMLWSVIEPIDMPRRRPCAPEGDPR